VPRRPRAFHAGIYHVAARASDTRHLFPTDHDRHDFLHRLAQTCELFELALISYVLMGTHYHTLIRIPDARISRALQCLHTEYSRWHNRRHGRSAHLFRAHPLAREISSDRQLIAAARYVALNPVEARLAATALDWPWSSAPAHAGLARSRIPLFEHDLSAAFGGGAAWRREYRSHITRDGS
jgi:putative transposase